MKTRNDCEIACDCVKRANVVLHVGLCKEIFARKHTATHKPTSAQPLSAPHSDQRDIHTRITRLWSPLAYGLGGNKWRTRMKPRRPPVCKILLPRWYRAPRLPCVLAGHKTSAPWVIDAYVALLSWLLVLVVFFPIGSSAWQCFV